MKKETYMIWENMNNPSTAMYYRRAKIFGGWLVEASADVFHTHDPQYGSYGSRYDWRVSVTFVPDPTHEWVL